MSAATDLLAAARAYWARGWSVLPVRDKLPTIAKWKPYTAAPAPDDELRRWFESGKPNGVAIICGPVSGGLVVRDFDDPDSYHKWAAAHPALARSLPTVRTVRGYHVYAFAHDARNAKLTDGELRSRGLYVVAPPSRRADGDHYQWVIPLSAGPLPTIDVNVAGLDREWGFSSKNGEIERTEQPAPLMASVSLLSSVSLSLRDSGGSVLSDVSVPSDHSVLSVSSDLSVLSVQEAVKKAIMHTLPRHTGERNMRLFEFARSLKAIPAFTTAEPSALRSHVQDWWRQAGPAIETKDFDTTWADFIHAWGRVKFAKGQGPMDQAISAAKAIPIPDWASSRYDSEPTRLLVCLCAELQRNSGADPFFLSCRAAGDTLGIDHAPAARLLKMLVADGVLVVAQLGTKTRAARYRFIGNPSQQ